MIIDTQEHTLPIRRVKQLMTMLGNAGFNEYTEVEFHYYPGSGWTVDVVEDEEDEEADAKDTLNITPNITTPNWTINPHWGHAVNPSM